MKWLWFILFFLLLSSNLNTPTISCQSSGEMPIKVGERYEFEVKHKFVIWISLGKVTIEVLEKTNIRSYECLHLRLKMELGGVAAFFKSFYYQVDSWLTVDELVTIQLKQYENMDGRIKTINIEVFPETWEASFETVTAETTITTRKKILSKSRDFLGLLFLTKFLKKEDLKQGDIIYLNALAENQHTSYLLKIIVLNKKTLKINGETFNCQRVEPLYQATGLFKEEEDRIFIWIDFERGIIPLIERGADRLILRKKEGDYAL